jgi:hypothetical protein
MLKGGLELKGEHKILQVERLRWPLNITILSVVLYYMLSLTKNSG